MLLAQSVRKPCKIKWQSQKWPEIISYSYPELDMIADIHHSRYCGLNSQRLNWVGWRGLPYWVPPGSVGGFWVMLLPGREIHRWIKLQG